MLWLQKNFERRLKTQEYSLLVMEQCEWLCSFFQAERLLSASECFPPVTDNRFNMNRNYSQDIESENIDLPLMTEAVVDFGSWIEGRQQQVHNFLVPCPAFV